MRIARLELARFGKFSDRSLSFPKRDCDLHVVYGPNEAGKSTLRQALLDLLYGIHPRSKYGFRHGLSEMRIGGVLENGVGTFEFQRFKRAKNPLVDAAGRVFSETELANWLGHTDRDFFERMYGLDYATLVTGGKEILDSAGDVGQMLFQAAAGVAGLHRIRERLEADARLLWGERKRRDAAYYAALDRHDAAATALRQASVSASAWQAARRARKAARADPARRAGTAAARCAATRARRAGS
ncbi:MAG TPA: AAA family ATPase, partial [Burkholderiaceae bacterium]|nr:AAA family ATPase [Burkholderiaceae bacterium]